jgi:PKD repeat protein
MENAIFLRSSFFTVILTVALMALSQVTSDFQISEEVCIDETAEIENQSSNFESVFWDFCIGDLHSDPSLLSTSYSQINDAFGYKTVFENGNYYSFVVSKGSNSIVRIFHGSDIQNIISVENLGNLGTLTNPEGIDILRFNDQWIGVVGDLDGNGDITRLNFESDLSSSVTATNLGNFGSNTRKRFVRLHNENGSLVLLFSGYNNSNIYTVDYGDSFDNTIEPEDVRSYPVPDLSLLTGFDIIIQNDEFIVYAVGRSSQVIVRLNYGNSLLNTPAHETSYTLNSLSNSYRITIFQEGLTYYGVVSSDVSDIQVFNFGNLDIGVTPIIVNYSSGISNPVDFNLYYLDSEIFLFGAEANRHIQISFPNDCGAVVNSSFEIDPKGISYEIAGDKYIWLQASDGIGNMVSKVDTLTVLPQTAPTISFTTDNACVSFEGAFDADTPDLSYSWDFGDGSIASGQNTSHQFASSGTYTVRLDVDDGTCGNFTEQEITIYEEPPIPDFEVVGNLCADGEIIFNNLTDDGAYAGPLTYQWDFNGQSTADTRDASFVFGSEGSKTVTLTSSIPGCENFFQTVIDLQPGPTSLFSGSSVCQNDLLQFTNQSTDADSYIWDFGDGFTSTQADASHVYTTSGNFTVQLEAFDLDGCSAIYEQEVAISPEPVADFSYDVACKGNQGVEFTDQSTVSGADILAWEWRVNDQLISTEQSPTLSFDETGLVDVSITVTSSNGCTQLYEETLDVLEDPDPAIQSDISCQSLVSTFTDNSANPETIVSRVWEIEGQTYTTQEVQHTFSGSGQIDVNLTVTGQNFCSSTLYTTVDIQPAASMGFSVSSYCDNDQIIFQDQSTSVDPIVSRNWTLDGETFFNGSTAALDQISPGTYTIGLSAQTESGCTFDTEQIIDINEAPEAAFSPSATYGAPPFALSLTNNSTGATTYRWLVNGNEIATSANTTYTISEEGDHIVELVASNASGCEDRHSINVISRVPAINLIVSDLTLTPNGNSQNVTLRVTNNGNLPIEIFDVFVSSSNDFSFSERINQMIEIGSEVDVQLNSTLQATSSQRICVKIQSAYDDINPDSNEACINFTPKVVFEDIYPNPFKNEAVVRFILPKSSKIRVTVANSTGKLMIKESYSMNEGLQILRYNSSQWEKGLYFITVLYNGEMTTKRVLKF